MEDSVDVTSMVEKEILAVVRKEKEETSLKVSLQRNMGNGLLSSGCSLYESSDLSLMKLPHSNPLPLVPVKVKQETSLKSLLVHRCQPLVQPHFRDQVRR